MNIRPYLQAIALAAAIIGTNTVVDYGLVMRAHNNTAIAEQHAAHAEPPYVVLSGGRSRQIVAGKPFVLHYQIVKERECEYDTQTSLHQIGGDRFAQLASSTSWTAPGTFTIEEAFTASEVTPPGSYTLSVCPAGF